jgi:hypothetical protein
MSNSKQIETYETISNIVTSKWILSLYKKVFLLSCYQNVKCLVLLLIERFLKVLSFVFPLKTILILNNGKVPIFLLEIFPNLNLEILVIFLTISTLISYLGVLKISPIIKNNISQTAIIIENQNKKTSPNINISRELEQNYSLIITSVSAIFFSLIILFLIFFLDQSTAWTLIFVLMIFLTVFFLSAKYHFPFKFKYFIENREEIQKIWLYLSYTIIFLFILNKLIIMPLNDKLINLAITFFLCRYAVNAANEFINHIFKIFSKYLNLNRLFFFNNILKNYTNEVKFTKTLNFSKMKYLAEKMTSIYSKDIKIISIHLSRASFQKNICLDLVVKNTNKNLDREKKYYILKIFDKKYDYLAMHELEITKNNAEEIFPVLKMLKQKKIDEQICILYEKFNQSIIEEDQYLKVVTSILISMWSIPVSNKKLNSYLRTHGNNIPKIDSESIKLLQTYIYSSKSNDHENLLKLEPLIDEIVTYIAKLPITLYNKDLQRIYLNFCNINNKGVCYHWTSWSLRPIGSNLTSLKNLFDDEKLNEIIKVVKNKRKDCYNLDINQLRLTETYFELLDSVKNRKINLAYKQASKLVSIFLKIK